MEAVITRDHFKSEADAIKEIERASFHPLTLDVPATSNDFHWHDFDTMVFILDGALTATEKATGETYTIRAGDKLDARSGVLHREHHDGFRAVFGFSVDPATFTMPIDKPPPVN